MGCGLHTSRERSLVFVFYLCRGVFSHLWSGGDDDFYCGENAFPTCSLPPSKWKPGRLRFHSSRSNRFLNPSNCFPRRTIDVDENLSLTSTWTWEWAEDFALTKIPQKMRSRRGYDDVDENLYLFSTRTWV